jgi:hypothetical protein
VRADSPSGEHEIRPKTTRSRQWSLAHHSAVFTLSVYVIPDNAGAAANPFTLRSHARGRAPPASDADAGVDLAQEISGFWNTGQFCSDTLPASVSVSSPNGLLREGER